MKTKCIRFLPLTIAAALALTGVVAFPVQASVSSASDSSGTAVTAGTAAVSEPAAVVTAQAAAKKVQMAVSEKYTITVKTKKAKIASSNKKVVSVKKTKVGKKKYKYTIKAKKAGKATIRYTNKNGKTVKRTIVVKKPQLNYSSTVVYIGEPITLKLNAAKGKVKWSSSDTSVATVEKISEKQVRVSGVEDGPAVISAKVGSKTVRCKVRVYDKYTVAATLFSDDNIEASFGGYYSDGVYFYITNKTDQALSAAFSTLALYIDSYDIIGSSCYAWTTIPANSTVIKRQALPDAFSKYSKSMSGCLRYKTGSADSETKCFFSDITIGTVDDIYAYICDSLVSNDYMRMNYIIGSAKIWFLVCNGLDEELTFTLDALTINGSSDNLVSSETVIHVAPGSIGFLELELSEELIEELKTLSGQVTCSSDEDEIITVFEDVEVIK